MFRISCAPTSILKNSIVATKKKKSSFVKQDAKLRIHLIQVRIFFFSRNSTWDCSPSRPSALSHDRCYKHWALKPSDHQLSTLLGHRRNELGFKLSWLSRAGNMFESYIFHLAKFYLAVLSSAVIYCWKVTVHFITSVINRLVRILPLRMRASINDIDLDKIPIVPACLRRLHARLVGSIYNSTTAKLDQHPSISTAVVPFESPVHEHPSEQMTVQLRFQLPTFWAPQLNLRRAVRPYTQSPDFGSPHSKAEKIHVPPAPSVLTAAARPTSSAGVTLGWILWQQHAPHGQRTRARPRFGPGMAF